MAKVRIDLSEAAEGGAFNPRNVEEGDYVGKIKACVVDISKQGNKQLVFTITADEVRGATYPYYCPLEGKGAWKTRNMIEAIGKKAPKAAASVDTDIFINKPIGFELVDDEYEGRMKSVINQVFPASDVTGKGAEVDDDDEDEDDIPAPKKRPAPEPEDDDDEEDDEEDEEPAPKRRAPVKKRRPEPEPEDDEDEDEEEEPAPRRRPAAKKAAPTKRGTTRRKAAPVDDDEDDLDELDIEEL